MKSVIVLATLMFAFGSGFAQTYESQPVTAEDVVRVLDLQPEELGVRKFRVDFGAKKVVTIRYTFGPKEVRTWKLEGKSQVLTIMVHEPKEGERKRMLMFWVDGESDGVQNFFDVDSTRTKHWRVGFDQGVFRIAVGPTEDMKEPEYTVEISGAAQ